MQHTIGNQTKMKAAFLIYSRHVLYHVYVHVQCILYTLFARKREIFHCKARTLYRLCRTAQKSHIIIWAAYNIECLRCCSEQLFISDHSVVEKLNCWKSSSGKLFSCCRYSSAGKCLSFGAFQTQTFSVHIHQLLRHEPFPPCLYLLVVEFSAICA